MPVSDYLNDEFVSIFNKHIVKATLENPGLAPMNIKGYSDPEKHEIFMPAGMEHLQLRIRNLTTFVFALKIPHCLRLTALYSLQQILESSKLGRPMDKEEEDVDILVVQF